MHVSYFSGKDLNAVKSLLEINELPTQDLSEKILFITAYERDFLIGCIGLESYDREGLLRSLAVDHSHRNKGVGDALFTNLLDLCIKKGLQRLHLLTTTADQYFLRKGFAVATRDQAPDAIKSSTEFSSVCPSSAVYMVRNL